MAWMWMVAVVAETFHVLPTVAARDLARDPDRISLACVSLLRYAEAKRAYDDSIGSKNPADALKAWENSEAMKQVMQNSYDLMKRKRPE